MNTDKLLGGVVFVLVPLLLWGIASMVSKRKGPTARVFAFMAGSDNRLSLSRLQALAWTLVIFGSFAAAMAIHSPIIIGTAAERAKAVADEAEAVKKVGAMKADAVKTADEEAKAAAEIADAEAARKKAEEVEKSVFSDSNASNDQKTKAKADLENAQKAKARKEEELQKKKDAAYKAKTALDNAEKDAKDASVKAKSYNWVDIPGALLMLAGIAIGSGVFSSLISALNSEDKTACVTAVTLITAADIKVNGEYSKAKTPKGESALLITGDDLGTTGTVKLGREGSREELVPILFWSDDGTKILIDESNPDKLSCLAVETPNGKLWYKLDSNLKLGDFQPRYELADLFRDDKNPNSLDLMKFQMFGWTLIAIIIYSYLFLSNLSASMESLPIVPESIVILTGLSQTGYLAGKGISNVSPNGKK